MCWEFLIPLPIRLPVPLSTAETRRSGQEVTQEAPLRAVELVCDLVTL